MNANTKEQQAAKKAKIEKAQAAYVVVALAYEQVVVDLAENLQQLNAVEGAEDLSEATKVKLARDLRLARDQLDAARGRCIDEAARLAAEAAIARMHAYFD